MSDVQPTNPSIIFKIFKYGFWLFIFYWLLLSFAYGSIFFISADDFSFLSFSLSSFGLAKMSLLIIFTLYFRKIKEKGWVISLTYSSLIDFVLTYFIIIKKLSGSVLIIRIFSKENLPIIKENGAFVMQLVRGTNAEILNETQINFISNANIYTIVSTVLIVVFFFLIKRGKKE